MVTFTEETSMENFIFCAVHTHPNMAMRRFNSKTLATSKYIDKKTQATDSAQLLIFDVPKLVVSTTNQK